MHDCLSRGGFTAAGFSHKTQGLTPPDGKIQPVHCREHLAVSHIKTLFQVFTSNNTLSCIYFTSSLVIGLMTEGENS